MHQYRLYIFALFAGALTVATVFNNCGSFSSVDFTTSGASTGIPNVLGGTLPITGSESNVMPIAFSSVLMNIPTVSIKICTPGTSNCQVISNILLDTGSTGLRLYSQAISIPLGTVQASSGVPYGECYQFGSAVSYWGTVQTADVYLGGAGLTGEKISSLNFQVMNSTFKSVPTDCSQNGTFQISSGPDFDGYNGLIGIQPFTLDCGENCTPDSAAAIYYTCPTNSSTCSNVSLMPSSMQVPNPVARLGSDGNGFVVQVPTVAENGAASLSGGFVVFGIGTQSDNQPSGVTVIPNDSYGSFLTVFDGQSLPYSFIDSGSNDLAFPTPNSSTIPSCSFSLGGNTITMFCPQSPESFTAILTSNSGSSNQLNVGFQLMNGETAWEDPVNTIYSNIGEPITDGTLSGNGSSVAQTFDWGLPIFFGKTIYFGMENSSIPGLGSGPFNGL